MKFTFTNTKEQWIDFQLYTVRNSPQGKKRRRTGLIVHSIMAAVFLFYIGMCIYKGGTYLKQHLGIFLVSILFIVYICVFCFWNVWYIRISLERALKNDPDMLRGFLQQDTIEINDGVIREQSADGSRCEMSVDGILKVAETKLSLLLYVSSLKAFVIPLTVFASDDEKKTFTALFTERCL